MTLRSPRFAFVAFGDRLVAAAIRRRRADVFSLDSPAPAAALRAELDQREVAARTVAIGLPRSAVIVKPLDLPAVDGELPQMVKFELERHLPYAASEEIPFDFAPLPRQPDSPSPPVPGVRQVLVAAADRRVIEGALRIADDARLRPVSVTVAVHDLTALVSRPRRGRIVWLHRVGDTVELLFLSGPTVGLSRSVAASDAVVSEIRRSLLLLRWPGCDAVWCSGDGPRPDTIAALGELEAPVTEPPYTTPARRWLDTLPEGPRGPFELALAVAAARRGRPLDLIPPSRRPRRLTRGQVVTAGMLAATILLAFGALLAPGYRNVRRLEAINAQIAGLEPEVKAVEGLVQALEANRRMLDTIRTIETTSLRPLPVLRELTELIPAEAWLMMLALDAKGVELTGQAASAAALIPLLENSPTLERVEFASPVTRGRDREQFRIRAAWEGNGAARRARTGPGGAR